MPLNGARYLIGDIYNDQNKIWPDGRGIHTSRIVLIEMNSERLIFHTAEAVYLCRANQRDLTCKPLFDRNKGK